MPELPEVETFANELRPHLVGQRFLAAHILWPRTLAEPDAIALDQRIRDRAVVDVGRRAKYLIIGLDSGESLIVHLRMTGRLEVVRSDDPILTGPHLRAWFDLAGGERLTFTDTRKFGRIWLVSDLGERDRQAGARTAGLGLHRRSAGRTVAWTPDGHESAAAGPDRRGRRRQYLRRRVALPGRHTPPAPGGSPVR